MYKCKICSCKFEKIKSLQSHISQTHKITSKDYYDRYLKMNDEGICYCGNKTNYKNMNLGYHKYCSTKCQSNDVEIIEKRRNKVKGDNHWTKRLGGPNKGKTYEEMHGEEKAKELKERLSNLGKKLTGENNPFHGKTHTFENKEMWRNKRLGKTYEEIYGFERAQKIRNKLMKPDLEKTGWRDYWSNYPLSFTDHTLRVTILRSQNYKCPLCFKDIKMKKTKNLHHINYIKKDNRRRNLIYLCISCHGRTNVLRNQWKVYLRKINREIIKHDKLPRRTMLEIDKEQSLELREKININRRIHYG